MNSSGYPAGGLLVLAAACLLSVASAAASAKIYSSTMNEDAEVADILRAFDATAATAKRSNPMDCDQRCETHDIKVFKAYWRRNYPQMHFIEFLRDLVVYSAYYPELRAFKPLVDRAVQGYEICRYITCSTDYLG